MSKPKDAIELPIPSDLTLFSYVRAFDLLLPATKIAPKDTTHAFCELHVPSQLMLFAAQITALADLDTTLMLEPQYERDEWSLRRTAINGGGDSSIAEIWSPGA